MKTPDKPGKKKPVEHNPKFKKHDTGFKKHPTKPEKQDEPVS